MKKLFLLIVCAMIIKITTAQTYDTTTYYGKMAYIFNNIDRTPITTGLLRDYGIDFMNLDNYDGKALTDTNWVTLPDWRSIYATLYSEQIKNPINLLYLDTVNNLIGSFASSSMPATFVCLYYNYNVLDTNAATNNLITISGSGQLNDVANRTQSPYLLHSTFAIAPTQQVVQVGSNQFVLHPELFLTNTGKTVSLLQIDATGSGIYQTVNFNTPFTVNYPSASLYPVTFKITYTDGSINYSHTKLAAVTTSSNQQVLNYRPNNFKGFGPPYFEHPFIFGTKGNASYYDNIAVNFIATKAYQSIYAQGDYTVDLSINNTSGQIKKPLIVVCGFDPEATNQYTGIKYYGDYVQRIKYDWNNGQSIPLNGTSGLDNADSFDIIYLHWHNGTDYIERNAYLLERLIQIVDSIKAANGSTEKNVIIGTSMGGIITRWALRDMEINGIDHNTRLFISHDAPHWGANVPPAYQALVQYIAPWKIVDSVSGSFPNFSIYYKDIFPDAINGMTIFNSPAAKQMLIQRYVLNGQTLTADNTVHNSFQTEMSNMGWPLNCKNILLSNGTCDGSLTFPDNNNQFLNITGKVGMIWTYFGGILKSIGLALGGITNASAILAPNVPVRNWSLIAQFPLSLISTGQGLGVDFGAWAVPSSGTSLIFKGNVSIHRTLLWVFNTTSYILKCNVNSTSDMLPLDNAPGGKYDISMFGINIDSVRNQLKSQLGNWIHLYTNQTQFCFVPTVSSLAFSNPTSYYRSSFCSIIPCLLPTQVSDYYAPTVNQLHVSYTNDNSNWVLQRQDANFSCALACPYMIHITGNSSFCSSGNYTLINTPSNATVTWSATPSNIAGIQSNGSTATLTKTTDGQIILNASVGNTCNGTPVLTSTNIAVGLPTIATSQIGTASGGMLVNYYCSSQLNSWKGINLLPNIGSYGTTYYHLQETGKGYFSNNSATLDIYSNSDINSIPQVYVPTSGSTVTVTGNNSCGAASSSPYVIVYTTKACSSYVLSSSPNPAASTLNITVTNVDSISSINSLDASTTTSSSETSSTQSLISNSAGLTNMYLYDFYTNQLVKKWNYKENTSGTYSLNVSEVKRGIYVLKMERDNISAITKVILQ